MSLVNPVHFWHGLPSIVATMFRNASLIQILFKNNTGCLVVGFVMPALVITCYSVYLYLYRPITVNDEMDELGLMSQTGLTLFQDPAVHSTSQLDSQGHIFVYSSYEEQTNGARNIWQLEIWAKLLDMKVAEPFAVNSVFGIMGIAPNFSQTLRFGDYYNIEIWNKEVMKYHGVPLTKWEEFLYKAPRKAIIFYTAMRSVKKSLTFSYGVNDMKRINPGKYEQITIDDFVWLKNYFNVVKVVNCVRSLYNYDIALTLEEFKSNVFGKLRPNEVTLIIVNWIGMHRIHVKLAPPTFMRAIAIHFVLPYKSDSVVPKISPSQRILKAYKAFLSGNFGNNKYVGIVFRTHTILYYYHGGGGFPAETKHLLECSKNLSQELDKVRNRWKIFMAYDLGAFGSVGYYDSTSDQRLIPIRDQIFLDVFKGSLQVEQRKEMLIKAAGGVTDTGFIALLEKTIATHADCIILLGPLSSFVQSSATDYILLHDTDKCVVSICSENFYDTNGTVISTSSIPEKFLNTVRV